MAILASVFPILPGKTEEWKSFIAECNGKYLRDYEASRREKGVNRETVFLQSTPMGDMTVVVWDSADMAAAFQQLAMSAETFDTWFKQKVLEINGIDLSQPPAGPLPELYLDIKVA